MATDSSGIMALPAMDQQQGPGTADLPEAQMVFENMRQSLSPGEASSELLSSASQVDPQAVAEFTSALQELDVPPEILDLLDRLVDEVLANPENYEEIRDKYRAQGVTEDILPEEFDPALFGALNLAIDQLRGTPPAPQGFAEGGIAELKPIAQALASYGRNGDTMLAHITPEEARLLKKHGGSGTINPATGLPEFANIFRRIGRAIKKFAGSTVGKLVIGSALFMVAGPAAAQFLAVTNPIAVAGISGFVSGAGTSLLAGGNLRDALKAGAIGGITAGALRGLTGMGPGTPGSEAAPGAPGAPSAPAAPSAPTAPSATPLSSTPLSQPLPTLPGAPTLPSAPPVTPPISVADPFAGAKFAAPSAPSANILAPSVGQSIPAAAAPSAVPPVSRVAPPAAAPSAVSGGTAAGQQAAARTTVPGVGESIKRIGEGLGLGQGPADWTEFKRGVSDLFMPQGAGQEAIDARVTELMNKNPKMPYSEALKRATNAMTPGVLRTYGPAAAAGLGIMGLSGGFQQKNVQSPYGDLFTGGKGSADYLLRTMPSQFYIQNMPGVTYYGGSVLPPPGYAKGGEVQHFQDGGELTPVADQVAKDAATATPNITPAAAQVSLPKVPAGVAAAPTTQVTTPAVGGYNMFSPAAQNMYYGVLNQGLLSGTQYNPQTRQNEPVTISAPSVATPFNTAAPYTALGGAPAQTTAMPPAGVPQRAPIQFPMGERLAEIEGSYRSLLGRDPDVAGLMAFGSPQFNLSMQDIRNMMLASPERQQYLARLQGQQPTGPEAVIRPISAPLVTPVVPQEPRAPLDPVSNLPRIAAQNVAPADPSKPVVVSATAPANYDYSAAPVTNERERQINDLYRSILNRDAEQAGLNYWRDSGLSIPEIGAQIEKIAGDIGVPLTIPQDVPVADVSRPVTISSTAPVGYDYSAAPVTNEREQQINDLYRNILNRDAERGGLEYWRDSGLSIPEIEAQIRKIAGDIGITVTAPQPSASSTGSRSTLPVAPASGPAVLRANTGGIASLGQGGYPRRTGQISGPGTEKSDSIPAMLSDGEFVMTAKAVRGAGNGSRREGAKKMYALMHRLERNASRS